MLVIRVVSTSSQLVVLPAVHGTMFSEAWGTPQAAWIITCRELSPQRAWYYAERQLAVDKKNERTIDSRCWKYSKTQLGYEALIAKVQPRMSSCRGGRLNVAARGNPTPSKRVQRGRDWGVYWYLACHCTETSSGLACFVPAEVLILMVISSLSRIHPEEAISLTFAVNKSMQFC
jgi:hypothetical protein